MWHRSSPKIPFTYTIEILGREKVHYYAISTYTMARGAVRAPYTASSAKPFINKRSKPSKTRSAEGDAPKPRPQARSTATQHLEPDDAYTYLPSLPKRHRTSAVQLSLTKDEAAAAAGPSRRRQPGADSEDEEDDMEERIRKVAMQIAEEGPGVVESDESDVDSDLAWEEGGSDEERWGDVFRDLNKGKGKKVKGKAKEVIKKVCPILLSSVIIWLISSLLSR